MQAPTTSNGLEFLHLVEDVAEKASALTDEQRESSGKTYAKTLEKLGTVLSLLYRAACCGWGCRGGDHQLEWLVGRAVNEAMASYRLLRSAFYDESLVLTRGVGEIANLLWLFEEPSEFAHWRGASRTIRMKHFSPAAVRKRLQQKLSIGAPISDDRYRRLCEVGSHPVPWVGPNLFSGGTRPVLGHVVQVVGLLMATNELAFAIAMVAAPVSKLLELEATVAAELRDACVVLVESIGNITIDKYDEITAEQVRNAAAAHKNPAT